MCGNYDYNSLSHYQEQYKREQRRQRAAERQQRDRAEAARLQAIEDAKVQKKIMSGRAGMKVVGKTIKEAVATIPAAVVEKPKARGKALAKAA